jgi:hypothetical protein
VQQTIRTLILLSSLAPAIAEAGPFSASVQVTTTGNAINVGGVIIVPTCDSAQSGSASLGLNCSTDLNNANARVGPGYMQLSAFSTVTAGADDHSSGTARAQASFSDSLYFDAPLLASQTVTLSGNVVVEGVLSAAVGASFGGATASWTGYGGAFGVGLVNQGIKQSFAGGAVPAPDLNLNGFIFPIVASLQFDATGHAESSMSLTLIVEAQSTLTSQGSAGAGAQFGNTVYWSGIDSFTVNGVPFAGAYAVTSASGANYRVSTSPVPESSTLAMLLSGLALLSYLGVRRA